jgi:hypothetical protein
MRCFIPTQGPTQGRSYLPSIGTRKVLKAGSRSSRSLNLHIDSSVLSEQALTKMHLPARRCTQPVAGTPGDLTPYPFRAGPRIPSPKIGRPVPPVRRRGRGRSICPEHSRWWLLRDRNVHARADAGATLLRRTQTEVDGSEHCAPRCPQKTANTPQDRPFSQHRETSTPTPTPNRGYWPLGVGVKDKRNEGCPRATRLECYRFPVCRDDIRHEDPKTRTTRRP